MKLFFTKMHGLGNDFVVIDATQHPVTLKSSQIRAMANRKTGIGYDQLLMLESSPNPNIDFIYRIFNADGSEVEQCGNGARCVARFIKFKGLSDKEQWLLQARGGLINVKLLTDNQVAVDLAEPHFAPAQIPFIPSHGQKGPIYYLDVADQKLEFRIANIGNPHAVVTVSDLKDLEIAPLGSALNHHPAFPEGVNLGFMQISHPQHIHLRVFERGAGETLACGSGACAAVVVGQQAGLLDSCVNVSQAGGDLRIEWLGGSAPLKMIGPAEFVFNGEWSE